jgi:hypothetical protein
MCSLAHKFGRKVHYPLPERMKSMALDGGIPVAFPKERSNQDVSLNFQHPFHPCKIMFSLSLTAADGQLEYATGLYQ